MQWIKQNNVVSIAVIGSEDVETYVPSQILKEEAKKKKMISVTSLVVPRLKIGLEMQETQV